MVVAALRGEAPAPRSVRSPSRSARERERRDRARARARLVRLPARLGERPPSREDRHRAHARRRVAAARATLTSRVDAPCTSTSRPSSTRSARRDPRLLPRPLHARAARARSTPSGTSCGGPVFREVDRAAWARTAGSAIGWPKEYGGQGRSHLEQFIFWDETYRARAPLPLITVNTVGPTLMQFGHARRRRPTLLPKIRDGELLFGDRLHRAGRRHRPRLAPDARRARRRRVRDQRPEDLHHARAATPTTSGSRRAPTPTRRSTRASRSSWCRRARPASRCTPIRTLGGERTNATYYEDVRVPVANRVGPENEGWRPDHRPAQPRAHHARDAGLADRLFDEVWALGVRDARRPAAAACSTSRGCSWRSRASTRKLEALKLLNWRSAWLDRPRARPAWPRPRPSR